MFPTGIPSEGEPGDGLLDWPWRGDQSEAAWGLDGSKWCGF